MNEKQKLIAKIIVGLLVVGMAIPSIYALVISLA